MPRAEVVFAASMDVRFKVCGITRAEDAALAAELGASCLGFILYPKSPRFLPLDRYAALRPALPAGPRRVAVMVEPGLADLTAAQRAGFDLFQIHFNTTLPLVQVREWGELMGADRLWLAPRLQPAADLSPALVPLAQTFLLDTFEQETFGGSGRTGDWEKFARHRAAWPDKTWILAGGLNPDNIAEAVARSGATFVDVNSGVESSPGVKDPAKLRRLAVALGRGRERNP